MIKNYTGVIKSEVYSELEGERRDEFEFEHEGLTFVVKLTIKEYANSVPGQHYTDVEAFIDWIEIFDEEGNQLDTSEYVVRGIYTQEFKAYFQ